MTTPEGDRIRQILSEVEDFAWNVNLTPALTFVAGATIATTLIALIQHITRVCQ